MAESVEGFLPEFSDLFLLWKMMLPNTEVVGPRNRTEERGWVEGRAEAVCAELLFVSNSYDPVDRSPPGLSVCDSPGKKTGGATTPSSRGSS